MQERDYQWFLENYKALYSQYGVSYLAIKDRRVIGNYKTFSDGVKKTLETESPGTFIVQFCNGDESGFTNCIASMNFSQN